MDIRSIEEDLDYLLSMKQKIPHAIARKWQWRILNEYPDDLKDLVYAWVTDSELPDVSYNDISFERIMYSTPFGFLDAVDLLYILSKDKIAGYEIFRDSVVYERER